MALEVGSRGYVGAPPRTGATADHPPQQVSVPGSELVAFFLQMGFSRAKVTLILNYLASTTRTPGADNQVHFDIEEINRIAGDPNIINAFAAKAKQALATGKLDPIVKPKKDLLAYVPSQTPRTDIEQPTLTTESAAGEKTAGGKAVVYNLDGLLALGSQDLGLSAEAVLNGSKQLSLLAA